MSGQVRVHRPGGQVVYVDFEQRAETPKRTWLASRIRRLADAVDANHAEQTDGTNTLEVNDIVGSFSVLLDANGSFCIASYGGNKAQWAQIMSILARATHLHAQGASGSLLHHIIKESAERRSRPSGVSVE